VGFIGNDLVGGGAWADALWRRLGELDWKEGRNLTARLTASGRPSSL
jgi:hypothetical protein